MCIRNIIIYPPIYHLTTLENYLVTMTPQLGTILSSYGSKMMLIHLFISNITNKARRLS